MTRTIGKSLLALMLLASIGWAQDSHLKIFSDPVRLSTGNSPIQLEQPGFASPAWADMTGDGKPDLLVGQFNSGKIMVYPNMGKGKLGLGYWMKAGGKVAEIPGVW